MIKSFPFGVRAERQILHRCANERVQDLLLADSYLLIFQASGTDGRSKIKNRGHVLDQVKDSDPIANRRNQTSSVRCEENIAIAVNCSKQIRELPIIVSWALEAFGFELDLKYIL